LKRITTKLDKYIEDKKERKYKKVKASILKNITSNNISKKIKNY